MYSPSFYICEKTFKNWWTQNLKKFQNQHCLEDLLKQSFTVFLNPEKTRGFLLFSEGIEMEHWRETR